MMRNQEMEQRLYENAQRTWTLKELYGEAETVMKALQLQVGREKQTADLY